MLFRFGLVCSLLSAAIALAQPSCEILIEAWGEATEQASSYTDIISVTRKNNGNELFYQEGKHYRKGGDLIREVTTQRSALPFPIPARENRDEEDGGAEAFCNGATVSPLENGDWFVNIADNDSGLNNWRLTFSTVQNRFVPVLVEGDFNVNVLIFSLNGSFRTQFKDWIFMPKPEER